MKKLTAILLSAAFLLCGCSEKVSENSELSGTQPWNRYIMETENGYYSNFPLILLEYYDKYTGNEIVLCNKPECPHDGRETCAGTYKKMLCTNSVMYNGQVYFAGRDYDSDNDRISLFCAAPDGSSIKMISPIDSVKNKTPDDKNTVSMIHSAGEHDQLQIRDGYAYIYYSMNTHEGYQGFNSEHLVQIDLHDGKVRKLVSREDYFDPEVENFWICGKNIILKMKLKSGSRLGTEYRKLSLETMDVKVLDINAEKVTVKTCDRKNLVCIRNPEPGESGKFIFEYDPENEKDLGYEINASGYTPATILSYNGNLYVEHNGTSKVSVYEKSKKICDFDCKPEGYNCTNGYFYAEHAISDGKFYVIMYENGACSEVYCCRLEDVKKGGTPDWEFAYSLKAGIQRWNALYSEVSSYF